MAPVLIGRMRESGFLQSIIADVDIQHRLEDGHLLFGDVIG